MCCRGRKQKKKKKMCMQTVRGSKEPAIKTIALGVLGGGGERNLRKKIRKKNNHGSVWGKDKINRTGERGKKSKK